MNDSNDNFYKYLISDRWAYSYDQNLLNEEWVKKGMKKNIFYLNKIKKISKENNIQLILVVYPSALEILKRIPEKESFHVNFFRNWAEKNSIEYLNFYKIFNKYSSFCSIFCWF